MADPEHIRQLVFQLVSNAVRYTTIGRLTVRVGITAGQAMLQV